MDIRMKDIPPGCEPWTCRAARWWRGLSHHRQNMVVGIGALLAALAIVGLMDALGIGSGPHWVWNITN